MPSKKEALAAISELNGKEIKGRAVNVNEARPRAQSRRNVGGGGRRGGGFGGGGGGYGGGGGRRRY